MNININNYEEHLFSYIDGELNAAEEAAFRQFMLQHPELQKELQLLEATKLPVEHDIVFRDKKSLYKQETQSEEKIFLLRRYPWLSVAAAACAALLVVFYLQFQKQDVPAQAVAVNENTQTSHQPVKSAAAKQDTVSPAETLPGEQKGNAEPQKKDRNIALAAASPDSQGKNRSIHQAKEEKGKGAFLPQKEKKEIAAGNTLSPLPALRASPVSLQKPVVNAPRVALGEKGMPANETTNHRPEEGKLLADNINKRDASFDNKITSAASRFSRAKEEMDSTITHKLNNLNQKTSGFINNIAKNGIKIGHITFAFNN